MKSFLKRLKHPLFLHLLVLITVVMILTVPFIGQPFHLDDRDYVLFANVSAERLTKFNVSNTSYGGVLVQSIRNPHGPFLTIYLGLLLRLGAPESETLFHAAYIVFPLLAAFSMYSLSRRFTNHPLAAAVMLLVTPGFFVLSHSLTDNVPGLSLGLATAALYVWGVDKGDYKLLAASGVTAVLGVLTAYQTLSILPALLLYGLLKKPRRLIYLLPFIMLAIGGIAWIWMTFNRYSRFPEISYNFIRGFGDFFQQQEGHSGPASKIRAILIFLSGSSVFFLSMLVISLRKRYDWLVVFFVVPPLFIWSTLYFNDDTGISLTRTVQVGLLTVSGFIIIYKLFAHCLAVSPKQDNNTFKDSLFLLSWFISVLVVYLVYDITYVTVRHLLLLFPPIILLFIRETERNWPRQESFQRIFIGVALFFTALMGLIAAITDYRFASIYPQLAEQLKDKYTDFDNGDKNVFVRGEFGFRYYLEKQGFQMLHDKSEVKSGDIIIYSRFAASVTTAPWPEGSYTIISEQQFEDDFPFRIMSPEAGAGFYGHPMGPLPLAYSRDPVDEIIEYQIQVTE